MNNYNSFKVGTHESKNHGISVGVSGVYKFKNTMYATELGGEKKRVYDIEAMADYIHDNYTEKGKNVFISNYNLTPKQFGDLEKTINKKIDKNSLETTIDNIIDK